MIEITGLAMLVVLAGGAPEAMSLLGEELHRPDLAAETRANHLAKLEEAIIWHGRRTAYLGRYRDAVAIYSDGLEEFPDSYRLLRHRGHRHVSLRQLDLAIADLERASRLIEGIPDAVEPDGLPNARNTPTSTTHSNIWYHLGLAYYLTGDFENAVRCYRECMKFSNNPDMLSATSHWLYTSLRRAGQHDAAQEVLKPIHADMDIIENRAYHRLLLMYRGELTPEQLLEDAGSGIAFASAAYGVANFLRTEGREKEGRALLYRIVADEQWAAFGHIAAEADLSRVKVATP